MIGSDMSVIVKTVVAVLLVPVMMYGFYVIVHGHLTPGGGFPGGAIIATMVTMFLVAYGKDISRKLAGREGLFAAAESVGLLLFGLVALIGLSFTFFSNFMANSATYLGTTIPFGPNPGYLLSGGIVPIMNIAVGLEVAAALTGIVVLMFNFPREEDE
jgi:multicomponent Na+:H+ antiporter subunit B